MSETLSRRKGTPPLSRLGQAMLAGLYGFGYRTPLYRLRLKDKHPLKISVYLPNPFPGNAETGNALMSGILNLDGEDIKPLSDDFWARLDHRAERTQDFIHSFEWLSHLSACDNRSDARRVAETLLKAWLKSFERYDSRAWRPDRIGRRLITLMTEADLVLASSDLVYRSRVLTQVTAESKHLARTARFAPKGPGRIAAFSGLALRGLLLPDGAGSLRRGLRGLERALANTILADGGPETRNPADALDIARILTTLKLAIEAARAEQPDWLLQYLDRIVPFLKGVAHADGGLAALQGAYHEPNEGVLKTIFKRSGSSAGCLTNMALSGFQRLEAHDSVIIMDVAPPAAEDISTAATASCLGFALSNKKDVLVASAGGVNPRLVGDAYRDSMANRASRSHATLTINGASQARINTAGRIKTSANTTQVERNENEAGIWLDASHDAWSKRFGVCHQRRVFLNAEGSDLRGEDALMADDSGTARRRKKIETVILHFPLHPDVSVSAIRDGEAIILKPPSGRGWLFRAKGGTVKITKGTYSPHPGKTQKTAKITVEMNHQHGIGQVNWSFRRMDSRE